MNDYDNEAFRAAFRAAVAPHGLDALWAIFEETIDAIRERQGLQSTRDEVLSVLDTQLGGLDL